MSSRWGAPTSRTRFRCPSARSYTAGARRSGKRSSGSGGAPAVARDQPRGDGYRHERHRGARLSRAGRAAPRRADRRAVRPLGRPRGGHVRHRWLRAGLGSPQAHVGQAHEDLQRPAPARLGPAYRPWRDQPAAVAARIVDHARQGQPRRSGGRQPDGVAGDRARPHRHPRRLGGPASAQRDGARHHPCAVHLDPRAGERRADAARQLRRRHRQRTPSGRATWCSGHSGS